MTEITDTQIATAIAKLHADNASNMAELVEVVVAFIRLPIIKDRDLSAFCDQMRDLCREIKN